MDRTVDPKKQPGPSLAPGAAAGEARAHPAGEAEGNALCITDAQGMAHRGNVVLCGSWVPELGCLDEGAGEEFRIVVLCEPPREVAPAPECGVAVCAPDVATRRVARVRETAVAYRTRSAEADPQEGEPGLALEPEHGAALSRGQLVACPTLDVSARDVFSPEEPSPRLILLAEALLAQRIVEPCLRVLAAALTAPASPLRCERAGLLAALDGLLRDARGKSGDPRRLPPAAVQATPARALESLGQVARAACLAELAETAGRLYPQPSALGEDIFLCRALVERPREAKELIRLRTFLAEAIVPDSRTELAMDRTVAQEQLSFAVLVAEGHRWSGIRAAFDRFRGGYRKAYLEHHRLGQERAQADQFLGLARTLDQGAAGKDILAQCAGLRIQATSRLYQLCQARRPRHLAEALQRPGGRSLGRLRRQTPRIAGLAAGVPQQPVQGGQQPCPFAAQRRGRGG